MIHEELNGQLRLAEVDPLENKQFNVRKRTGALVPFDETRILIAIESAFKSVSPNAAANGDLSSDEKADAQTVTTAAVHECFRRAVRGETLEIEQIQDIVESQLMSAGHLAVARSYIVYRENRRKARAIRGERADDGTAVSEFFVTHSDGTREAFDPQKIRREMIRACRGLEDRCVWNAIADEALQNLYDGVRTEEIRQAMIFAAKARIEHEPHYSYVAARLLLKKIHHEVLGEEAANGDLAVAHRAHFRSYIEHGIAKKRLSSQLAEFDLEKIADALQIERDEQFQFIGLQTVYDRYLLHVEGRRIETPQYFWMRVSMGLASGEGAEKEQRAIEFYETLSSFRFMSSTPTLFNSGTLHPQLSSCYLSTVMDDLDHIFKVIGDDARLSKWAGGLGNDWTNVRATGSRIHGTNGESQGVIPFLKVANDTAVAVNQGGKRKGAMCAYLETWHLDVEDFLELRKNTGDERRRTHDMNTANWIPDLFMKRVVANGEWTLFSPSDVPDLHDLYGAAFEQRYLEYERKVANGEIKLYKRVEAIQLWRKMLTMLFETGHPWITFKDPSNLRSPQDHTGVVHSSNLCTEILLNTSADETAVCNLGSINLAAHIANGELDAALVEKTIGTAMRMLDNVIDINYYPTPEARASNLKHRPVGLGLMGFQDALYKLKIPYASAAAIEFADRSMELISYHAILASSRLAAERGTYESYAGSKWSRGLLPIDTIEIVARERGGHLEMDRMAWLDWSVVRESVAKNGVRNSNTMAIAPTATISNIIGVSQSIEPSYKNLYAKSNLSGEFTTVNEYLVAELKQRGLWDAEMVDDLKYFDGSIQEIERIPDALKEVYRCSFEIEPKWLIECASRRQKWLDMGQSLNLYIAEPNGKKLHDMYLFAWTKGLKTTYYLRATAATSIEKSTTDINRRGLQPRWMKNKSASSNIKIERESLTTNSANSANDEPSQQPATIVKACLLDDPTCESCQ